jgi:hypothetical protein
MTPPNSPLNEQSFRQYICDAFHAPPRWALILGWSYSLLFLAGGVVCGVMMFRVASPGQKIIWGAFMLLCAQIVFLVKIWFWLMIERRQLQRDLRKQ